MKNIFVWFKACLLLTTFLILTSLGATKPKPILAQSCPLNFPVDVYYCPPYSNGRCPDIAYSGREQVDCYSNNGNCPTVIGYCSSNDTCTYSTYINPETGSQETGCNCSYSPVQCNQGGGGGGGNCSGVGVPAG